MNFAPRTWIITSALALAGISFAGEARAQNTYADVPFNQGSLFYRPSGARPPRTTTSRPTRWRIFRPYRPTAVAPQVYQAAPRYVAPTPVGRTPGYTYTYPQYAPAR